MQNYADDSELAKILSEAREVMSGIAGQKEMGSQEMMDLARRIAASTEVYTGQDSKPVTHFIERSARKVKSKIGMHIDMLKSTASNISEIRQRIKKAPDHPNSALPESRTRASPEPAQLGDYNRKIDETLKYLSTRTAGKTQIEQKIKKYRDIMGDVEGTLKDLPKNMNDRKLKKGKPLDHKLAQRVDHKTEEMVRRMQSLDPGRRLGWNPEGYSSGDDDEGVGDWINYEGFNSKEDLDRFNEVFKEFVGEYPKEYEKRNHEEGWYEKDGMGRAIDYSAPGHRRVGLYSPGNNSQSQKETTKLSQALEKNLRGVLSKAMNGEGDPGVGSVKSERKFLEDYLDRKMDTIPGGEGLENKGQKGKKKKTKGKVAPKKKPEVGGGKLCMDGPSKKGATNHEEGDQKAPWSPTKASKKPTNMSAINFNLSNDRKKPEGVLPKPSEEMNQVDEHNINWDMERIKKLIVKERQEQLRKKREAWERNNELSEEMIDREKLLALKKGLHKPSGPFDAPIPSTKPSPSDFVTDRERHDKMYRKAVKGREGVYHKEDLDYEFGVNPFYYEPAKNKKDDDEPKEPPVTIRGYRGVRKREEVP